MTATDPAAAGHKAAEPDVSAARIIEQRPPGDPGHARLAEVYRAHFDFVWRSLRRLRVPTEALDDATQDVFVVAARRLEEFEGRAQLKTWLYAIATRVAKTHARTQMRRDRRHRAYAQERAAEAPNDPVAQRDAAALLAQLLDELDDDKRDVFVLIELEGMTAVEVAEGYGVNVNTVYTRLRAARKRLEKAARRHAENGGER